MSELTLEEEQAIKERCKKSNKGWFEGGLTMYQCPVCTKQFCVHDQSQWAYKRRITKTKQAQTLYLCSYTCCRTYDRVIGERKIL